MPTPLFLRPSHSQQIQFRGAFTTAKLGAMLESGQFTTEETAMRHLIFAFALSTIASTAFAADHAVKIAGMKFVPASIELASGDTVTFTNADAAPHTATAKDGAFDTGRLAKGESKQVTVAAAGEHPFVCKIHPMMKGTVTAK